MESAMSGLEEVDRGYDQSSDYKSDYTEESQARNANWNLRHLTISETTLKFLDKDPNLHDLMPLIDQICSTNSLDNRSIELYRCMLSSKIMEKMAWTDEDDETGFGNLDTARMYLFQFLDGTRNGYRGKLATILKRTYTSGEDSPKRKKFLGLF